MALGAAAPAAPRGRITKTLDLDADLDAALKEIARREARSQANLIRKVLRDYVELTLPAPSATRGGDGDGETEE